MESFFVHSVTITRPTFAQDAGGYPLPTYATLYSGVNCRIEEVSGREGQDYKRLTNRKLYRGKFPPGLGLTAKDRVTFGTLTLEVANVNDSDGVDGMTIDTQVDMELTV